MNSTIGHTENYEVERVKRVENFFDQAHNYWTEVDTISVFVQRRLRNF